MSEVDSSDDDFQTPRLPRTGSSETGRGRTLNTQLTRIQSVNRRIQARALQANEDAASEQPSGIAVELGQLFRENVASNRGQGRGRGRTVGRPWASFRVRFTCLQDPGVQFTSNINHTSLRRQGLGIPQNEGASGPSRGSSSLPLTWSGLQVMEYITQLFPILSTVSYHFCYAVGSRLVRIPDHIRSSTDLKTFFKEHRRARVSTVFIRPDVPILYQPLGTPTVLGRIDARPVEEDRVQEPIEETRNLRRQQDAAYEESLRTDRERTRQIQYQLVQDRLQREREERVLSDLQEMRAERQRSLPEEPSSGFMIRFRLPGGFSVARRFLPETDIEVLMAFVGSQSEATREFRIQIPGSRSYIHSSETQKTLQDVGVSRPTNINVCWMEEEPDTDASPSTTPDVTRNDNIQVQSIEVDHLPSPPRPASPLPYVDLTRNDEVQIPVADATPSPAVSEAQEKRVLGAQKNSLIDTSLFNTQHMFKCWMR